jgi:hypothetical protein
MRYIYYYIDIGYLLLSSTKIECKETELGNPFYYTIIEVPEQDEYIVYSEPGEDLTFEDPGLKFMFELETSKNITEYYDKSDEEYHEDQLDLIFRKYRLTLDDLDRYNSLLQLHLQYHSMYSTEDSTQLVSYVSIANYHPSDFTSKGGPYSYERGDRSLDFDTARKYFIEVTNGYEVIKGMRARYPWYYRHSEGFNTDYEIVEEYIVSQIPEILLGEYYNRQQGSYPDTTLQLAVFYYIFSDRILDYSPTLENYYNLKKMNYDFDCEQEDACDTIYKVLSKYRSFYSIYEQPYHNGPKRNDKPVVKNYLRNLHKNGLLDKFLKELAGVYLPDIKVYAYSNLITYIYVQVRETIKKTIARIFREIIREKFTVESIEEALKKEETFIIGFIADIHNIPIYAFDDPNFRRVCEQIFVVLKQIAYKLSLDKNSLKNRLKYMMNKRWDYEVQCDIFEGLDKEAIDTIASAYGIDTNLSRMQICNALADILEQKKSLQKKIIEEARCTNETDLSFTTDVRDIDYRKFITVKQDDRYYCFDIEEMYNNLQITDKNPFTGVSFDESEIQRINEEYKKYLALRGKRFDEEKYQAGTTLSLLIGDLFSLMPYSGYASKLKEANRELLEVFIQFLGFYRVPVDIKIREDLNLTKIEFAQKLLKIMRNNPDYQMPVTVAWKEALIVDAINRHSSKELKEFISSFNYTYMDVEDRYLYYAIKNGRNRQEAQDTVRELLE